LLPVAALRRKYRAGTGAGAQRGRREPAPGPRRPAGSTRGQRSALSSVGWSRWSAQPVQRGGRRPRLAVAAERFTGERLVVLGEAAVGELAQRLLPQLRGHVVVAASVRRP